MEASGSAATPALVRVALRKNLARSIRAGHPWVFRDALRPTPDLADGSLVLVTTADGRPLGRGFWTARTPIAVRMLTTDAADRVSDLVPRRLEAALQRRLDALDLQQTNAFRWVHGEADLLPGLHLDVYGPYGAVRFDGPGARVFYRELPALIGALGARIGLHTLIERVPRRRDFSDAGAGAAGADEAAVASGGPLLGRMPAGEIEVRENGLRFGVDLVHGQKGGLFLDQRDNRQRVRGWSRGLHVLNLFGYTGGFSVYAAAGGAAGTVTVDSAAGAVASARGNFIRNGLPESEAELVVADVFAFLAGARKQGRQWDLVISDPPSFAPRRQALPEALRAYRRLHALCAAVVRPAGTLCAASCSSHVDPGAFLATVTAGCADAGRLFRAREHHGAGVDHPVLPIFPEGSYLKFSVGDVMRGAST